MNAHGTYIKYPGSFLLLLLLLITPALISFAQDSLAADTVTRERYEDRQIDDNELNKYQFNEIAAPDSAEYFPYAIPDSALEDLREDDAFWYANTAPEKKKESATRAYRKPMYLQPWFRNLVWVLIVASFTGVIMWFLVASDVRLFRKKPKALATPSGAPLPNDLFAIDYDLELQKAMDHSEYRLGVRLMYLHILRLMAEKEIILYKMERTNSEYLAEVFRTPYYKAFFNLTRSFDYVWYGNFNITEPAFKKIRQAYIDLKNKLAS